MRIMNISILHYSLFGIAGGQEIDLTFVKFVFTYCFSCTCKCKSVFNVFRNILKYLLQKFINLMKTANHVQ